MRAPKYRRAEHAMAVVYGRGLGMRPPYAMLVDGLFCRASFRHRFDLQTRLESVLGGAVRPLVSGCVLAGLRADADAERARAAAAGEAPDRIVVGTAAMARRVELRRCGHRPALPGAECIRQCVISGLQPADDSDEPRMRFVVATDDADLKKWVRSVPGTPLVYVERTFPLLEAPTRATLELVSGVAYGRQHVHPEEAKIIQKRILGDEKPAEIAPLHKRKRAKAPNPLSVKPKTTRPKVVETAKRKRKKRGGKKGDDNTPSATEA